MKKFIFGLLIFISFNILAQRYEGGYISGKWYSFYNNTYLERSCIQLIGDDVKGYGCPYYHADEIYLNEEDPSEFTITGIAEIGDEILLNISDFKLKIDGEAYTPYNYPVSPEKRGKPYFPEFDPVSKKGFTEYLKNNHKNLEFNNKEWTEEYKGKKIKFLGVEKINLKLTGTVYKSGDTVRLLY